MEDPIRWALFRLGKWFGRCPSISNDCYPELCQGNGVAMCEALKLCEQHRLIRHDERGITWIEDLAALVRLAYQWPEIDSKKNAYPQPTNYARDGWIHDNFRKMEFGELSVELKIRCQDNRWALLTSRNGIKTAARRYANFHGYPDPCRGGVSDCH